MAKLKITWKCLNSFVQGCSSKSVDKILCMAISFTETWPGLVQEVHLCNLGKFWQWSPIFLPSSATKIYPDWHTSEPAHRLLQTYTCRCRSILLKFTNGYYLRKSLKHGTYCNKNTIDKECFWYVIGSWKQRTFPRSAWSDTNLIWILCCKNVLLATKDLIYIIKVINKDTLVCVIKLLWVKLGNNFLCILFKF